MKKSNQFRQTTRLEKIIASLVNIGVCFILSLPILIVYRSRVQWQIAFVVAAGIYQVIVATILRDRCLGLRAIKARWEQERYPTRRRIIFHTLYFLHDASVAVWIFFPFDIFLANILILQLPLLLIANSTFQNWTSGFKSIK